MMQDGNRTDRRSRSAARWYATYLVLILLLGLGVGATVLGDRHPSATAPAPHYEDPVRAEHGLVVAAHEKASQAGVNIMKQGGNAIDAAVATGFALAVVYPNAGNLGGGGFMVIRDQEGQATTIDFREKAPRAATRDMYLDSTGTYVPRGYLASGVPGSVAGLLAAHERYGQLPRRLVMQPAIELAAEGFRLSADQAARFNQHRETFLQYPATARYFTKADSTRFEEGDLFVQEDLAEVLRRIRVHGRDDFYSGKTARLIVEEMERGGGLITREDLMEYEVVERAPITATYRGYRLFSMPPPSSGGIALAQLLHAVEPYDLEQMGFNSSAAVHLMGEAMRRVYADRSKWLGDADYFPVPVDELVDPGYMRRRMADFNPYRASVSDSMSHGQPVAYESRETTHYSVVDSAGMAVSVTTTLNGGYGSKVVVDGAGFFMNNEMDDFSAKPGVPNMYGLVGSEANAIEPGKRMLSSMSPSIVEDPQGRLFMVIGTPGGSTIITTVFQVILNVIDHGMNIKEAVSAPRVHHQWLPDLLRYERWGLARDVVRNLEHRGWTVRQAGNWGRANGITVRYQNLPDSLPRLYLGGADPRRNSVAVGY